MTRPQAQQKRRQHLLEQLSIASNDIKNVDALILPAWALSGFVELGVSIFLM
jgi:hypothetical protein